MRNFLETLVDIAALPGKFCTDNGLKEATADTSIVATALGKRCQGLMDVSHNVQVQL